MGRSNSEWDDWKRWIKGWPYKGDAPDAPEYVKDRDAFFKSNAPENAPYNGWWRCQGYKEKETNKMFKRKESNK